MNRADAQLACQRFATSKLRAEQDLHSLTTLGFRGEALPSISSIARLHLKTTSVDSPVGTEIRSQGGMNWEVQDCSMTQGTQVEIRDIFFNTPGRQKFLKTVATEFAKISYVVQQAAAVNPTVHFRLLHHTHKVLEYPAVATTQDRLLQIYGSTFLERFLPINLKTDRLNLKGFTVSPHHARTSRTPQEIFVNGRPIKNTTISHAINEGYRSFLPKGRHPQFILFIQLDPQTLDINVHPTKREVRFAQPETVHSGILNAIKQVFFSGAPGAAASADGVYESLPTQDVPFPAKPTPHSLGVIPTPFQRFSDVSEKRASSSSALSLFAQEPSSLYPAQEHGLVVVPLGQIHCTYLLGQINQDVFIVDQHTAHERVLFERLLRSWNERHILQQGLLIPEPIEVLPHQANLLEEWLPVLTQAGLEIERFGATSYIVRAIPAVLGAVAVGPLILELLEELSEWQSKDSLETLIRPILATMACQSAVQAGRTMTLPEITTLLQDWAQEKFPMTCPHGRRVALRHSLEELNTLFARASE